MKKHLIQTLLVLVPFLFSCGGSSGSSSSTSSSRDSSSTSSSESISSSSSSSESSSSSSSSIERCLLNEVDSSLFSYIAHRGLHDDKVPENSIAAFKAASSASLAIETDVHLTKDKRLVISHDSSLEGFGKIESNTLEDIQEGYHLSNGEKLPSFQEMLSEVPDEKMIVLELKIPDGTSGEGIAKALLKETEGMDLSKKMVVVSFNLEALSALSDSQFNRGLLVSGDTNLDIYTSKSAESITTSFCEFYDVAYTLLNRSESLSYRERGGKLIGWTFTSQGSVNSYKNVCDGYTFEGFSPSK